MPHCDPGRESELVAPFPPPDGALADAVTHRERQLGRLQLWLPQRDRVVEEDHHPVSGEVLEGALVSSHELAGDRVVLGEDVDELFRFRRFGEGRESAEVEVDDGDVGPVAGQDLLGILARDQRGDLRGNEARELRPLPLDHFQETCVYDRDRGLVGERLGERDVLVAERALLAAVEDDDADQVFLDDDRNPEQRPVGPWPAVRVLRIGLDIGDMDGLPGDGGAADHRRPVERVWVLSVVRRALPIAVVRDGVQQPVVEEPQ
jgi:hypothetical protein